MQYTLAIDQGTHASRAILFDDRGRIHDQHSESLELSRQEGGRIEQDASHLSQATRYCVHRVIARTGAGNISACGLSTQRSTVLAWRRSGQPVSPALSWQDTRGAQQLRPLESSGAEVQRISGLPLSAHYGASKLHWLQAQHAGDGDIRCGPLASFLLHTLLEQPDWAIDHSNAQRMQLMDIETLNWSPYLCELFDVSAESLPRCRPVQHRYGTLEGLDIPLTTVCGDQNAAWFADGVIHENTALVNIGTGAFVMAPLAGGQRDPALLTDLASSDGKEARYLVEATVNGAASALQWLRRQTGTEFDNHRLDDFLQQSRQPAVFINSVGGLGAPWWSPSLQPGFTAATKDRPIEDLISGVAESIVFLIVHNLQRIQRHQQIKTLRVSGGLSASDGLCRRLADLSGLPLQRGDNHEASARGVAWLAAGQPAGWHSVQTLQPLVPQTDKDLNERYASFIEQLEHRLQQHE